MVSRARDWLAIFLAGGMVACGGGDAATGLDGPRRWPILAIISGNDQVGEAGAALVAPLVVELRDTLGAPAPGVFVRFTNNAAALVDSGMTGTDGRAAVQWTLGTVAGAQQIVAQAILLDGGAAARAT